MDSDEPKVDVPLLIFAENRAIAEQNIGRGHLDLLMQLSLWSGYAEKSIGLLADDLEQFTEEQEIMRQHVLLGAELLAGGDGHCQATDRKPLVDAQMASSGQNQKSLVRSLGSGNH